VQGLGEILHVEELGFRSMLARALYFKRLENAYTFR
jgi:hypothetical protein